jgi:hypothetical protein
LKKRGIRQITFHRLYSALKGSGKQIRRGWLPAVSLKASPLSHVFKKKGQTMNGSSSPHPRTLFAKIWDAHVISEHPGQGTLLYIDRHMLNEVTTPQPFASLRAASRRVRRPESTFALIDHSIPTTPIGTYGRRSKVPVLEASRATQIATMERNVREFGVV